MSFISTHSINFLFIINEFIRHIDMKNALNERIMHFDVENRDDNEINVKCDLISCNVQLLTNLYEKSVVIKIAV